MLGTLVTIRAGGKGQAIVKKALEDGFSAVAKVARLMSFHEESSDISRLNAQARDGTVTVHPWTFEVLQAALDFSRKSDGVFDVTVAPQLVEWDYLPGLHHPIEEMGNWRDIVLEENCGVRFRRRLLIDLGGIAKGFAVDRGIEAMMGAGASDGFINAGGDARVFGDRAEALYLRNPTCAGGVAGVITLRERAIATSSTQFTRQRFKGAPVSALLDGRTRSAGAKTASVTVAARSCIEADALTKVVFALGGKAKAILESAQAEAVVVERNGRSRWLSKRNAPD